MNPYDVMGAQLYGSTSDEVLDRINAGLKRFSERTIGSGRRLVKTARDIYDSFQDSDAIYYAKHLAGRVSSRLANDIPVLDDDNYRQKIKPVLMRGVVSHPVIRSLLDEEMIDGYSTYINPEDVDDSFYKKTYSEYIDEEIDWYYYEDGSKYLNNVEEKRAMRHNYLYVLEKIINGDDITSVEL